MPFFYRTNCALLILMSTLPAVAQPAIHRVQSLQADAAKQLAQTIEKEIAEGGQNVLATKLYANAFWDRTARGFTEVKSPIVAEINRGKALFDNIDQQIAALIKSGGSYRLLRVESIDGTHRAWFRFLSDEGINYHRMELVADAAGTPRVLDIYVAMTGQNISDTLRALVIPIIASQDKNVARKLTSGEQALVTHLEKLNALNQAHKSGDSEQALKIYNSLPKAMREMKQLMSLRIMVVYQLLLQDEEKHTDTYAQAARDYEKLFPEDPSLPLVMLDYWTTQKRWDQAMQSIDQLEKSVGSDFYLDQLRGNVELGRGRIVKAEALFEKVRTTDPSLNDPYYSLIDITVARKQYDKTLEELKRFEQASGIGLIGLDQVEGYEGFVASPEYKKWLAYLKKQGYDTTP